MAERAARGPSRYPGTVRDAGAPHRRLGGAGQQELHQFLQAPVLRSALGQTTPPCSPIEKEAGWWSCYARHTRPPVPPDGLRRIIECNPLGCAGAATLSPETPPDGSGIMAPNCLPPDPATPR